MRFRIVCATLSKRYTIAETCTLLSCAEMLPTWCAPCERRDLILLLVEPAAGEEQSISYNRNCGVAIF